MSLRFVVLRAHEVIKNKVADKKHEKCESLAQKLKRGLH